jgi:HEAT repeat protein
LGELGDASAGEDLARALSSEHDNGVIEQAALALQMLRAKQAIPVLESKANNESPQTRIWILGALEALGAQREVPFIAGFLSDPNTFVAAFATASLERLTKQDFDLPKCGPGLCAGDFTASVQKAQKWWSSHKNEWQR